MPITLTAAQTVKSDSAASVGVVDIVHYTETPAEKTMSVALCKADGGAADRVPGMFTVRNIAAGEDTDEPIGGKAWSRNVGNHYDDMIAAATAVSTFGAERNRIILEALQAVYPDLAGTVS